MRSSAIAARRSVSSRLRARVRWPVPRSAPRSGATSTRQLLPKWRDSSSACESRAPFAQATVSRSSPPPARSRAMSSKPASRSCVRSASNRSYEESVFERRAYLAGPADVRASAWLRAWTDPSISRAHRRAWRLRQRPAPAGARASWTSTAASRRRSSATATTPRFCPG